MLAGGFGITLPLVSAAIVTATPPRLAGLGSGLQGATRELGSALGVAIVGTVLTASFAVHAPAALRAGAHPNPSEVLARAAGGPLHAAAISAYTGAVDDGVRVVALAVLAGAVLTAVAGPAAAAGVAVGRGRRAWAAVGERRRVAGCGQRARAGNGARLAREPARGSQLSPRRPVAVPTALGRA